MMTGRIALFATLAASNTAMRLFVSFIAVILVLAAPDRVAAQVQNCKSILSLRPKAEAWREAMRRLSYSSTDQNNCQQAQQVLSDYRSLVRQAGEGCLQEGLEVIPSGATDVLFGSAVSSGGERVEQLVTTCELAGVIPLRVSRHSCPAQADYEDEALKLLRDAVKLRNAERTPQVCRHAEALSRKIGAHMQAWGRVRLQCKSRGILLPYTEMLTDNPVAHLCYEIPSASDDTAWRDWFGSWFGGYRGVVIIPVGLIIFGVIFLFRLMRR